MQFQGVWSFQFLFNDKTVSNFDISALGGISNYKECAVNPEDYGEIHKVSLMYCTREGVNEG